MGTATKHLRPVLALTILVGCTEFPATPRDAMTLEGAVDSSLDAGADSGPLDSESSDLEAPDNGAVDGPIGDVSRIDVTPTEDIADAGPGDLGPMDTASTDVVAEASVDASIGMDAAVDAGPADTGPADTGPADTGPADTGPADTGPADTGPADTGPADTGPADTGPADTGPAPCLAGQGRCGVQCVDTTIDRANCGACGNECVGVESCVAGQCRTPTLASIDPPIAAADQTVVLNGIFGSSANVFFPGAAGPVAATVVGPGRLEAVVPRTATGGDLYVAVSGVQTNRLPFRRTTFGLGLQTFRREYEQTGTAREMTALAAARTRAASVHTDRWVYVLGGSDGSTSLNTIERAMVNADGTLFGFAAAGTLGEHREAASAVRVGNRVYLIGGVGADSHEVATIDATTGLLGPFSAGTSRLRAPRHGHTAIALGPWVYVVGGNRATVERAAVLADGSLGRFDEVVGVATSVAREFGAVAVAGRTLYIAGGHSGASSLASVESASIDGSGTLGAFRSVAGMTTRREGARALVSGSTLYVLGGLDASGGGGELRTIERLGVDSVGAPTGAFEVSIDASLQEGGPGATLALAGNHVYLVGGGATPRSTAERASLDRTSDLSMVEPYAVSLPMAVNYPYIFAAGRFVYVVGGQVGLPTGSPTHRIMKAAVEIDGTLGSFSSVAPEQYPDYMPFVRRNMRVPLGPSTPNNACTVQDVSTVLTINDVGNAFEGGGPYLSFPCGDSCPTTRALSVFVGPRAYILGGVAGTCSDFSLRDTVYSAPSSTMVFAAASQVLGLGQIRPTGFVDNETVYVLGGWEDQLGGRGIQRFRAGTTDPITATAGVLDAARVRGSVEVIGARVYVLGGAIDRLPGSTEELASCTRAPLPLPASAPVTPPFTPIASCLMAPRRDHASITLGNYVYVVGGSRSGSKLSSIERFTLQ